MVSLISVPEPFAGQLGSLNERCQLRPGDIRRHAASHPAVGAGNHPLSPDSLGVPDDPVSDDLRVLVLSDDGATVRAIGAPEGPEGELALDRLPLSRACLDGETVVPLYFDAAEPSYEQQLMAESGWQAALLVPVISRGHTIALLATMRKVATPWSRRHISNARTVAAMLGPVLDVSLLTA